MSFAKSRSILERLGLAVTGAAFSLTDRYRGEKMNARSWPGG